MGNFAENLNLGNRVRPPLRRTTILGRTTPNHHAVYVVVLLPA